MVAAEDARAVEVHREGLVVFCHLLASLNNLRHISVGCVAYKLQRQVYLVGLAPIDVTSLVLQLALQVLRKDWIFRPAVDGNG